MTKKRTGSSLSVLIGVLSLACSGEPSGTAGTAPRQSQIPSLPSGGNSASPGTTRSLGMDDPAQNVEGGSGEAGSSAMSTLENSGGIAGASGDNTASQGTGASGENTVESGGVGAAGRGQLTDESGAAGMAAVDDDVPLQQANTGGAGSVSETSDADMPAAAMGGAGSSVTDTSGGASAVPADAVGGGASAAGSSGSGGVGGGEAMAAGGTSSQSGEVTTAPFILGADISFVPEEEDKGTTFSDNGVQKDIVQLLSDRGFNYIRLRLFHSPGDAAGYQYEFVTRAESYCDQAHTIELAQRVKDAGMGLLLDFHYSDTWADPDDQHKPAAWEGLSFDELKTVVHDYTRDTLRAFEEAGALPDMVQVGNEITPGLLHPDGHTYEPNNWDQLAQLLTAGLSAVKEVNPDIQTMLHIDRGGDNETTVWWVGEAMSRGVQFDILGQSAYSAFHGGPSLWESNFADLAGRYPDLSFVIAEYNGDKRAANDVMHDMPGQRGLGTFFWEPTANGEWGDALFTWSGSDARANQSDFEIYDGIADDYGLR